MTGPIVTTQKRELDYGPDFSDTYFLYMKKSASVILSAVLIAASGTIYGTTHIIPSCPTPAEAGSNLLAYPDRNLPSPPSPPGEYKPFHIEHYGRHGSRWLLGEEDYMGPVRILRKAAEKGILTQHGDSVLICLEAIADDAAGNYGRLTPLGASQHRGIARRMFNNFPEVFAGDATIDAVSTIVVRCILSMSNELVEFAALNPDMKISIESGKPLQPILNPNDYDTVAIEMKRAVRPQLRAFESQKVNPVPAITRLISDTSFINDSINALDMFNKLFEIALNEQSHERGLSLATKLFTNQELMDKWEANNASWYVKSGYSTVTEKRMPQMVGNLIKNMCSSADSAIITGKHGASLRFGHETVLLPLACIMGLDNMDDSITSLDDIAETWHAYKAFPMGGNIQMVFYRDDTRRDAPVIVSILLNEHPARLPLKSINHTDNFYRWDDVKEMLMKRINP